MIEIRPATDDERRLVISTWLRSFLDRPKDQTFGETGPDPFIGVGRDSWLSPRLVKRGLRRAVLEALDESRVIVAVHEKCPDEALGWTVFDPSRDTVHYVYVVPAARRQGVGTKLLEATWIDGGGGPRFSHMTPAGLGLVEKVAKMREAA